MGYKCTIICPKVFKCMRNNLSKLGVPLEIIIILYDLILIYLLLKDYNGGGTHHSLGTHHSFFLTRRRPLDQICNDESNLYFLKRIILSNRSEPDILTIELDVLQFSLFSFVLLHFRSFFPFSYFVQLS